MKFHVKTTPGEACRESRGIRFHIKAAPRKDPAGHAAFALGMAAVISIAAAAGIAALAFLYSLI